MARLRAELRFKDRVLCAKKGEVDRLADEVDRLFRLAGTALTLAGAFWASGAPLPPGRFGALLCAVGLHRFCQVRFVRAL